MISSMLCRRVVLFTSRTWRFYDFRTLFLLVVTMVSMVYSQADVLPPDNPPEDFTPQVSAHCDKGYMTVSVITSQPFSGIVHTRDISDPRITKELRRDPCIVHGTGGTNTSLRLSLFANPDDSLYCGIRKKDSSDERSVAIAVRVHKTLELSEDKSYVITCGKNNFRNARNELFRVGLNFYSEDNRKTQELVMGRQYVLRAAVTGPGGVKGVRVKSCFSFASNTSEVELIDNRGCPKTSFMGPFVYNSTSDTAEAKVMSTFRFPDASKVHVQCDMIICQSEKNCPPNSCSESEPFTKGRAFNEATSGSAQDVQLMASTSAFVVDPGESSFASPIKDCTEWRFPWLIGLCIALAILLLIMLIVNIFLCSSLTCTCTKQEVEEREPSEIEDYDPYKGSSYYPGSHYGSRTSLHKPYTGGHSTLNSGRSQLNNSLVGSDHYTTVHSRPNSRYSHHSGSKEPLQRAAYSNNGIHYAERH